QPDRPDEAGCRAALAADRYFAIATEKRGRDNGWRITHWLARAEFRSRLSSADRSALSDAGECNPSRCIGTTAQHGLDRWQPAAAHPLLLLLRHGDAVQQARARH